MEFTEPKVFHVAQTGIDDDGVAAYLAEIGAPQWTTDAATGAEKLIEVMGKTCYMSFDKKLNANLTQTRTGSAAYLKSIVTSKHGSVLEHSSDSYMIFCSRAVTHQIVRTRVGVSFSQQSLHYVRIEHLRSALPAVFAEHPRAAEIRTLYKSKFEDLEKAQLELAKLVDIDSQPFHTKKALTTAMRRLAPIGMETILGMSANHRTWRWCISQRTSRFNDAEIRKVFALIFEEQRKRYPHLYYDAVTEEIDGVLEVRFENEKV
jgi:thymidylate synthase (FAD)